MPKISVGIMKIIDEKKRRKTKQNKKTKTQKNKWVKSYSEKLRTKWFLCAFKVLQLICKISLFFRSYGELTFSIVLKEGE